MGDLFQKFALPGRQSMHASDWLLRPLSVDVVPIPPRDLTPTAWRLRIILTFLLSNRLSNYIIISAILILPPYICQPTPVGIKVPSSGVFPSHVQLWRCMGGTYSIQIMECVVEKEKSFLLQVHDLNNYGALKFILVTNHTTCTHKCINRNDCDNGTIIEPSTCQCKCRNTSVQCNQGKV